MPRKYLLSFFLSAKLCSFSQALELFDIYRLPCSSITQFQVAQQVQEVPNSYLPPSPVVPATSQPQQVYTYNYDKGKIINEIFSVSVALSKIDGRNFLGKTVSSLIIRLSLLYSLDSNKCAARRQLVAQCKVPKWFLSTKNRFVHLNAELAHKLPINCACIS